MRIIDHIKRFLLPQASGTVTGYLHPLDDPSSDWYCPPLCTGDVVHESRVYEASPDEVYRWRDPAVLWGTTDAD